MKLFELNMSDEGNNALEKWKADVKEAYPNIAAKLRFKGRVEQGVNTISAEIPGSDRSYGVFDVKTETGVVLPE
jgi:hypothetical protein